MVSAEERNSLPRDVLRWIQGLDLSYSIKNVKRDFSNGFLVAEILSRYYEKNVKMHSFSNGVGMTCKNDNWYQLQRLFKKFGVECSKSTVNEIIHCKSGVGARFIEYLYTFLTGRKIVTVTNPSKEVRLPQFARATASAVIKHTLKQPEMLMMKDSKLREESLQSALQSHNSTLHENRLVMRKLATESLSTDASKSEGNESTPVVVSPPISSNTVNLGRYESVQQVRSEMEGVVVKEVQVKQLNKDISALRAKRDFQNVQSIQAAAYGSIVSSSDNTNGDTQEQTSLIDIMSSIVLDRLGTGETALGLDKDNKTKAIFALANKILEDSQEGSSSVPDEMVFAIFEDIVVSFEGYSKPILSSEIWSITRMLCSLIAFIEQDQEIFHVCVEACLQYAQMLQRQIDLYELLPSKRALVDYIFQAAGPKLVPLLRSCPEKRHCVLMILGAFSESDAISRSYLIKNLQEQLSDSFAPFLHCLTILIFMEENLSTEPPGVALLDLYAYYAQIGLEHNAPSLRAGALAMVAVVLQHDPWSIGRILPKLAQLAKDPWWEVQCQLLIVTSRLLCELSPDHEDYKRHLWTTVKVISDVFNKGAHANIRKVGLAYLGQHVDKHDLLREQYLDILIDMAKGSRIERSGVGSELDLKALMGLNPETDELPVSSACGGVYRLPMLTTQWKVAPIAREFLRIVKSARLQNFEPWHTQVLLAIVLTPPNIDDAADDSESKENLDERLEVQRTVYDSMKDYVFLAICDLDSAEYALPILKEWIYSFHFDIMSERSFSAAFKLLFSQETGGALGPMQQQMNAFFNELMNDATMVQATKAFISKLCADFPELMLNQHISDLEERI